MPDETAKNTNVILKSKNDLIADQAMEEFDAALKYRSPRVKDWLANWDLYANKKVEGLKGRSNVNLPIMSGFVDTLESKIDNPPSLDFQPPEEGDYKLGKKVNAAWALDSSPSRGNWAWKDILMKKVGIFTGRTIFKYYADSIGGRYGSHLNGIDTFDFLIDPFAGGEDVENAEFLGQDNLFRNKWQLQKGVTTRGYDATQVERLIKMGGDAKGTVSDKYSERSARYQSLGLNILDTENAKRGIFKLVEWYTTYEGTRYCVLLDVDNKVWVKVLPLIEMFTIKNPETDDALWPIASFAAKADAYNFFSVAPADDVREVNIIANIIVNQALDNRNKINYAMRGYDTNIWKDAALLEFRPDGLVPASSLDGNIQNGIYEFKTSELAISGSIDFVKFLDNFTGIKTGVSNDQQGVSDQDKVGIYFGNLQQAADRMNLINKSYSNMYIKLGVLYYNGLCEHLSDEQSVKIMGEKGVEWEKLTKDDLQNKNLDIVVRGGSRQEQLDELTKTKKKEFLDKQAKNPLVSQRWLFKEQAKLVDYDDADVTIALDINNEEDLDILSEAAAENELMLLGKKAEPNKAATPGHLQKHKDLAEKSDISKEAFALIMTHIEEEMPIVQANQAKKIMKVATNAGAFEPPIPTGGAMGGPASGGGLPTDQLNPADETAVPSNAADAKNLVADQANP